MMTKAINILKLFSVLHESAYGFNHNMVASLGDINDAIKDLESLEAKIAQLESELKDAEWRVELALATNNITKSCDGCEFSKYYPKEKYCTSCSRFYNDYYEPKQ